MDDPTVDWSKDRFDEVFKFVSGYVKSLGFTVGKGPSRSSCVCVPQT